VRVNCCGPGRTGTLWVALTFALALLSTGVRATAQDGIDVRSRFDSSPGGTLPGNRPGMSIGRGGPFRRDMLPVARPDQLVPPPVAADAALSHGFKLELIDLTKPLGDLHGTTLEGAIEIMRQQNPDMIAARSEVDQARSDIVTAGLRSNPQFYADMQQVPYRVLAPGQVDVNIAYPVDISGKRKTRVKSAGCVLRSVEWKNGDFERRQLDNLQTLFVDTLNAQVTVALMQKSYCDEAVRVHELRKKLVAAKQNAVPQRELIQKQDGLRRAEEHLRDSKQALDDVKSDYRDQLMALALFLGISNPSLIRLQGWLYDARTYPDPEETPEAAQPILDGLTRLALENRPDLQSQRWNLYRALADVDAVRASRLDDVSFLVQPYTYGPTLPNRSAWAVGVTIPLPIYNRQQGNLAKAQQIVAQTQAQLLSLENTVRSEVAAAYYAVVDTQGDMDKYNALKSEPHEVPILDQTDLSIHAPVRDYLLEIDPVVRKLANETMNRYETDYIRALVNHRKSLLRINTACACMVCPDSPFESSQSPFAPAKP
jgi:outer membrane protein, heavy metal efflux system